MKTSVPSGLAGKRVCPRSSDPLFTAHGYPRRQGDPVEKEPPKPAEPDRVNVYTCPKCGGYTVTIDIHEGVTPFTIRCRAAGQMKGGCIGTAESAFYPRERPIPPHIPMPPAWEWFKPVGAQYRKLSHLMREHIDRGGLYLRKRKGP